MNHWLAIHAARKLKGWLHPGRGQRPRNATQTPRICPARADQLPPSSSGHASIVTCPQCSHRFLDEGAPALAGKRHPAAGVGIHVANPAKSGVPRDHRGRSTGSCACLVRSHEEARADESARGSEKRFVEVREDSRRPAWRFSLAGWIRAFFREPLASSRGSQLHSPAGRASSEGDVSGRVAAPFEEIRRAIRRTPSLGLTPVLECPFRAGLILGWTFRGRCPRLRWLGPSAWCFVMTGRTPERGRPASTSVQPERPFHHSRGQRPWNSPHP